MRLFYILSFFFLLLPNLIFANSHKPTRTLIIYSDKSFAQDWMQIGHPIKRAFEFKYNCKVKIIAINGSSTILSRLVLDGKNSTADLVIGLDMSMLDRAEQTNLFAPHKIEGIKDIDMYLPIDWSNEYFIPYDYSYLAFIYNEKKLKNPPKSFQELVDRPDKDLKIIIQDPRSSSIGMGLLAWIALLYEEKAPEILYKLKKKIVTVTKDWSTSYGLFMRGEADMVLSYNSSPIYHMIAEDNYDIKAASFKEGHYLQIELVGKLKSSKEPELADQFMQFVFSRSFQRSIPINNFMFPIIDLGNDLPSEYSYLFIPTKTFMATSDQIRKNRNLWIHEWLEAFSKK